MACSMHPSLFWSYTQDTLLYSSKQLYLDMAQLNYQYPQLDHANARLSEVMPMNTAEGLLLTSKGVDLSGVPDRTFCYELCHRYGIMVDANRYQQNWIAKLEEELDTAQQYRIDNEQLNAALEVQTEAANETRSTLKQVQKYYRTLRLQYEWLQLQFKHSQIDLHELRRRSREGQQIRTETLQGAIDRLLDKYTELKTSLGTKESHLPPKESRKKRSTSPRKRTLTMVTRSQDIGKEQEPSKDDDGNDSDTVYVDGTDN